MTRKLSVVMNVTVPRNPPIIAIDHRTIAAPAASTRCTASKDHACKTSHRFDAPTRSCVVTIRKLGDDPVARECERGVLPSPICAGYRGSRPWRRPTQELT